MSMLINGIDDKDDEMFTYRQIQMTSGRFCEMLLQDASWLEETSIIEQQSSGFGTADLMRVKNSRSMYGKKKHVAILAIGTLSSPTRKRSIATIVVTIRVLKPEVNVKEIQQDDDYDEELDEFNRRCEEFIQKVKLRMQLESSKCKSRCPRNSTVYTRHRMEER
ncbi:hypothetical protein L1987_29963 [Smallanthus sonchifolius]|uniref:Uncharacterized protein n=1 Tax=Smallanthus sonchifolius TaxID=185202 RepID=A0ACB9I271_9ASTR|nr:hypothetical protein L1987_29963 [Smallanthus sonchifolius]